MVPTFANCKPRSRSPPVSTPSPLSSTWTQTLLGKFPYHLRHPQHATEFCDGLVKSAKRKHLNFDNKDKLTNSFQNLSMQWGFQKLPHWPANGKTVCCHLPFYSFLSSSPALSSPPLNPATHPAILPFSSGTTGPPKGVMVSHRNLITQTLSHVGDGEYYYRAFANFQDTTLVIGMMQSSCWKMTTPPRQFCQCSTFLDLAWQWRVLCGREQNKWLCQSNPKQQWAEKI